MNKMPLICDYEELYKYLGDYYQYRKYLDPKFNYEIWSAELGYKSTSYMKMIVGCSRLPTPELFQKFSNCVRLNSTEQKHFIALMMKARVAISAESEFIQDCLLESLSIKSEVSLAKEKNSPLLNHIDGLVVTLVRSFKDYQFSDEELALFLKLDPVEAQALFDSLRESDRLSKEESFKVESKKSSEDLKQFHLKTLQEAESKINNEPETTNFQCIYFSTSEERKSEMESDIQSFLNKMKIKYGDNKLHLNRIYKMNLNFYPVTPKLENLQRDLIQTPESEL